MNTFHRILFRHHFAIRMALFVILAIIAGMLFTTIPASGGFGAVGGIIVTAVALYFFMTAMQPA